MEDLLLIILKPDNIAVLAMILAFAFFVGYALWLGNRNDNSAGVSLGGSDDSQSSGREEAPEAYVPSADTVHCWPYLVRIEFIAMVVVIVILTVWSIGIGSIGRSR